MSAALKLSLVPPAPLPDAPRQSQQARPWPVYDRWSHHPIEGLTVDRIKSVFRCAEWGWLRPQVELFDDVIETDGHLHAQVDGRLTRLSGKDWLIQPGGVDDESIRAAQLLAEDLAGVDIDMVELFEHQGKGVFEGAAASEIVWGERDGHIAPLRFCHPTLKRFRVSDTNELRLLTERAHVDGEPLTPGHWVVTRRRGSNIGRAGLLRTAVWWAWVKRISVRDFIVFAEKFGIPMSLGFYSDSESSDEAREQLETTLREMGDAGQAILEDSTRLEISDTPLRSGDPSGVHPALITLAEQQISKLISGGTLSTDTGEQGGGSWALGKVHETSKWALEVSDAKRMEMVFRRHVSKPFLQFNRFERAKPPKLKMRLVRELNPKELAEVADIVRNDLGLDIDGAQLLDEIGLRPPATDSDRTPGRVSQPQPGGEQ